jgi:hypothetical protein
MRLRRVLAPVAWLMLAQASWADIEATSPDGKRYLLKDDGTWQALDAKGTDPAQSKSSPDAEAELQLVRKIEREDDCQLVVRMTNKLPYEIRHIVPTFSAYRANGVMHDTAIAGFQSIRPSDNTVRTVEFNKIKCADIARVQVSGGDRCEMGELHKFSEGTGTCLARVRVLPSEVLQFDK